MGEQQRWTNVTDSQQYLPHQSEQGKEDTGECQEGTAPNPGVALSTALATAL